MPTVTSLPGSPANGDEVYYQFNRGDGTNAYWHLRYNSGTTYWDYLGGPSMYTRNDSLVTTTNTTYTNLSGPSLTTPLAGDYDIGFGARAYSTANTAAALMSYQVGGTGASDTDAIDSYGANSYFSGNSTVAAQQFRTNRVTGISASSAITLMYRINTGGVTAEFNHMWLEITPVKVK